MLTYRPRDYIRKLICKRLSNFLEELERQKDFIAESRDIDFREVLVGRFGVHTPWFSQDLLDPTKSIHALGALNIYLAMLKEEEGLLDIADPVERAKSFHKHLDAHNFIANPISRQKLTALKAKAKKVLTMPHTEGIDLFLQLEKDLTPIALAFSEMAWDLEDYHQHMFDSYRGK